MIFNKTFEIQSDRRPTFDDVTQTVKAILSESGIQNGSVLVYTGHTTCSIQIQEYSDGQT